MAASRSSTRATKQVPPRIVIDDVRPAVASGRYPVKRVVGEPVVVEAAVFADGHDELHVVIAHQVPDGKGWELVTMTCISPGDDLWQGSFVPAALGTHRYRVLAWIDEFASWASGTMRKLDAGVDISSEQLAGAAILDAAASRLPKKQREPLVAAAVALREGDLTPMTDIGGDERRSAAGWYHASLKSNDAVASATLDVLVERERALFSSWYELFPRSVGAHGAHGTLRDVEDQLDYVADLGFDVLYLPPIHPIGHAFRKGRNNSEAAGPDDPGSPWAIGSSDGGHTALHRDLGSMDDFRSLVKACDANGIELAIDVALQASPDHPWVTEHPEWFKHRPDGSIQYAENPPKKYQDIYPFDFESDEWRALWDACLDIFRFWAREGIRIFRVDNPHTKPFAFWEWLIAEVRADTPDAIFLAEAFTRPAVMHRLAMVGFTLSYNYFPWRVSKGELVEYFTELSTPPSVDQFRPSSWPNTPDILPWHLMDAPVTQFGARVFLAATLSPSYGIYGPAFETADGHAAGNGKEEYLDSEKYQLRAWDRNQPETAWLRSLIADLNRIRTDELALHTLRTLRFHHVGNDALLCFSKTPHSGPAVDPQDPHAGSILVVANLDPVAAQSGLTWLDLPALGVDGSRPFQVQDLLGGRTFTWEGPENYVELHPGSHPGHIFRVVQGR
jgi:starch synthase (maltosyl-transferring)